MIRGHIEQAIRGIQAEKEAELRAVEQRVMQESIVAFNADVDNSRDLAIQQLTEKYNRAISELETKFAEEKNAVIIAGEERKKSYTTSQLAVASKAVEDKYAVVIAKLTNSLNEIQE